MFVFSLQLCNPWSSGLCCQRNLLCQGLLPAIRKTVLPALPQRRKITATCHPVPQFVQQLFLLPVKPFSLHPICSACSLVTAYFPVRCRYLFHTDGITSIFFLYCWFHLSNTFPFYKAVLNDFTRLAR